jgi:SAM-dependent methyltransferase
MSCPFCGCTKTSPSFYPRNVFNNKDFLYVNCTDCDLTYLNTLPNEDDYNKMYPSAYQESKASLEPQLDLYEKMPGLRFSYGEQLDCVKKYVGKSDATLLDYGCGNGHFLIRAAQEGLRCDGAEYNPAYISTLKDDIKSCDFYTIVDVLEGKTGKKYDVIRLSNVLEHLSNPNEVIASLKNHLTSEGILLIEGPIEHNFSLAQAFRNNYFRISKLFNPNRTINFPPYHIFFSNAKNQRLFFKNLGYQELSFVVMEDTWPFPLNWNAAKGAKLKIMALVARISIFVTKISQQAWGNTFLYVGKNNNP